MSDVRLYYGTTPDEATARSIAAALIEARLAACVNLLPGMQSIYRWQGRVEQASEVAMVIKSTRDHGPALIARFAALHPYECPALLELPVTGGAPAFLAWIADETM